MIKFEYELNGLIARTADLGQEADSVQEKGLFRSVFFEIYPHGVSNSIGHFNFAPMEGCCGVVVSYNTYLQPNWRGSGYSDKFRELKDKLAKHFGYSLMIATTRMDDMTALANMLKSNYRIQPIFENKRTKHQLGFGIKVLK